jgi:uncharacterized RDD family membrane protein YckC
MTEDNRYAPPRAKVADTSDADGELASLGARFAGAFIDGVLVAILVWPYLLTTEYWTRASVGNVGISDLLGLALVSMILFLVLHGYLLHKYGQTIGKRLVGTRIVSVVDNQVVPLGKVFGLRYVPIQLASVIPGLGSFLPLIDVLFIFREDRRCLHDLICGTKVIKVVR